jgi:NAD(P)H-dependent flavin oxidoreductase YrpB (nitropropane dioxygenase family)
VTFDLRQLEVPVVQAGMGTIARHELGAAVSDAGGLGTIAGALAPIARELAATRRWLRDDPRGPEWIRVANRLSRPVAARLPASAQARALRFQRPSQPFLGPQPPTDDGPVNLLDSGPLYAGETVARIRDVRPAAEIVRALAP